MSKPAEAAPGDPHEIVARVISERRHLDGALMPVLHGIQDELGWVPPAAVAQVAEALDLSRAEVHGVITYYHHFRQEPVHGPLLQVCRAESCQAAGGDALAARAEEKLGVKFGETTADNRLTLEPVYCLGLCHSSPAALLDHDHVVGMLDEAKLDALLKEAQA